MNKPNYCFEYIASPMNTQFRYYDYLCITIIFLVSFWFQEHVYLNGDTSWHLEASQRILAGGASYSSNLFDDNLPMVFWYFIPVVWLYHITGINIISLCNVLIELNVLISFLLCDVYLRNFYKNELRWRLTLIRYTLLLSFLFFPGLEFGQRDMIVVLFTMPYIFLIAIRVTSSFKEKNNYFQALLGFLAAIGIAMNPYYGLTIFLLEIYIYFIAKKIHWRRPEVITFSLTFLVYLLLIEIYYPDYYSLIIPSYFIFDSSFNVSTVDLIRYFPGVIIMLSAIYFYGSKYSGIKSCWITILWIAALSAYIVYFFNGKLYLSHIIFLIISANLLFISIITIGKNRIFTLMGCVLLFYSTAYAIGENSVLFSYSRDSNSSLSQLISFFKKEPDHRTLLLLTVNSIPLHPMISYIPQKNISPWLNCWAMSVIIKSNNQIERLSSFKKIYIKKYKKFFIKQLTVILRFKRPNYVIVNTDEINCINFINQHPELSKAWKHYHLIKTISNFDVYSRFY